MPAFRLHLVVPLLLLLGGCATGPAANPQDPLEPLNRGIYKFNDALDRAVLKPVAKGYKAVVPKTGRTMVSNFFSNLDDVLVTLNDVLQLKLGQATSDFGRILINSTLGVFGLVDAASITGFPKHDEDFGQTLGYWGIGSGPYLMLPILGPSSVRDGIGQYADSFADPVYMARPLYVRNDAIVVDAVSERAALIDQENLLNTAVIDRYAFIRDAYLQRRQNLVYDGYPPRPKYEDDDDEEDNGSSSSGTSTQHQSGTQNQSGTSSSNKDLTPPVKDGSVWKIPFHWLHIPGF